MPASPPQSDPARLFDLDVPRLLLEAVTIEPLALQEEFVRVPGDLAYWGAKAADAERKATLAKLERDEARARAQLDARRRASERAQEAAKAAVVEQPPAPPMEGAAPAKRGAKPRAAGSPARVTTEAAIDAEVTLDPMVQAAERRYIEAEGDARTLRAFENGVRAKRDMVLGEGRRQNAELAGDPVVRRAERAGL